MINEVLFVNRMHIDWDDSETALAHLGHVAPGGAKSQGDKLWEDNWDDDDIEEEFSVQLRSVQLRSPLGIKVGVLA